MSFKLQRRNEKIWIVGVRHRACLPEPSDGKHMITGSSRGSNECIPTCALRCMINCWSGLRTAALTNCVYTFWRADHIVGEYFRQVIYYVSHDTDGCDMTLFNLKMIAMAGIYNTLRESLR